MTIFDCFQYFNEEHVADLRFNVLDEFVDFFVIVESTVNHQGKPKKLHFDIAKYKKFKNKINYIVVDDTPEDIKKPHEGGESLVEQHQRNSLMKGLKNASDNDLVILSDVDEIPNLNKLNEYRKNWFFIYYPLCVYFLIKCNYIYDIQFVKLLTTIPEVHKIFHISQTFKTNFYINILLTFFWKN